VKTLVYGFGPYEEFDANISESVVRALAPRPGVVIEVFDVRFDRDMFVSVLGRHAPDVVIGLGQCRRGRKLRIESRAQNRWGRRGEPLRRVSESGPGHLFASLRLPFDARTRASRDAGTYVCNFSMYVCLEYCATRGSQYGFIHVPRGYDPGAAADYLGEAIHHAGAGFGTLPDQT
jgi:pyrrolidone-carboxylate peptidase